MTQFQFIGVDIAKAKFDVALLTDKHPQQAVFDNNLAGFKLFLKWLKKHSQQPWVCMEATGHYSELLAEFLAQAAIKVSVVNPLQIKYFAKATLTRNKNDILDARVIAQYCANMQPRVFKPRSKQQKNIRELIQLLDTVKNQKVLFENQKESIQSPTARKEILLIIQQLSRRIQRILVKIENLVQNDKQMKHKVTLLTSIKGIGPLTAYRILAYLPDLNQFNNAKQLAAFVGVSPKQKQSGQFVGKTCLSKFGHARLRNAFYMPALVAKNHNQALRPFTQRLENNGLAPKAIVGAMMRKLVHIVFGVLKSNSPFNPALV